MGRRLERLNEQLRRELTDLLRTEVRDPRIGPIHVTEVRASADLDLARVRVSFPDDEGREETLEGLAAAAPFLRTAIAQRLSIRHAPELRFEVDTAPDHARRIEELLREVRPEGGWESADDTADAGDGPDTEAEADAGEDGADGDDGPS